MNINGKDINIDRLYYDCNNNKIAVIRKIRELTGFGLEEAKRVVDLHEQIGDSGEYDSDKYAKGLARTVADDGLIIEMKGANGVIKLYEDHLTITRRGIRGVLGHGFFQGTKEIMLSSITGIQLKKAGLMIVGYIQFTILGGNESRRGLNEAVMDENTVTFDSSENKVAEQIKNKIYELQKKSRDSAIQPTVPVIQETSAADEIRKYKQLLDEGIITQEEFNAKKKQLLGL